MADEKTTNGFNYTITGTSGPGTVAWSCDSGDMREPPGVNISFDWQVIRFY